MPNQSEPDLRTFVWADCFVTGEALIDHQHRALVDLINAFGRVVMQGAPVGAAPVLAALDELADYAAHHFSEEDACAVRAGVDPLTLRPHREEHDAFVTEVARLRLEVEAGSTQACDDLLEFLVSWLAHHILEADQSLVRQIAAIRAGAPAAAAHAREVERSRATLTTDPLVRALNGLFRVLSSQNAALARANRTLESRVAARTADLAEANRRLEALALTDALTGLPNRRHALQVLDTLWRGGSATAILLLDLDKFKAVNDTYGHAAGDAVLRATARSILAAVRTDDLVSRLGGDEFLVILPQTALDGAALVAAAVRTSVAAGGVDVAGARIGCRASIGVAERAGPDDTPGELLRRADAALYRAKAEGRDRLATAAAPIPPG